MNILTYRLNLLLFSVFLSMTSYLFSQNIQNANCGNITSSKSIEFYKNIKPQLKKFEEDFFSIKSAKGVITGHVINSVPIKAYIIRSADGSGGLNMHDLNDAISNLNLVYADAYLEFFLCDGVEYIDNNDLCDFKRGDEERLTETNYVSGLINIYFTNNLHNESNESICGYSDNIGRNDIVVMKNSCATNISSLPHELGHFFSLLHTHGADNDSLTSELVDGSNCDTDGDGICDTPADPKLKSTTVDSSCIYTGTETDANGDTFTPDTNNMMSYSRKECRTSFTEQQLARMYAFYMTTKNYLSCPDFNANIVVNESETCEESLTVDFQSLSDNITDWQWDVDGDGVIDYTTQNPTHTFEAGIFDVILTVSNKSKTITKKFVNFIKVGTYIDLLDEDFENFNLLDKHGWTTNDVTGHGYHWYTNLGDTKSGATGPTNHKNPKEELNTYIYAEASGAQPGDITELISPCINVSYQNSELEFSYHMFGKDIGELHVDIKTESGYINDVIQPLSRRQQINQDDDFIVKTINLSSYTNETIKIRFRAVRGNGWEGDIAIDNIFVKTISTPISDDIFKVYPNPIKGDILYVKNIDVETVSNYQISNMVGQPFISGILTNSSIDFSNLPSGSYLLTLTNGKRIVVKKIIK
ncbi:MAG: T9SS type A sorting domain-containing protein [Algibacter sp.]|uniref:T9SS-dependent choice-of-anchor J family protein n=1 Tax=Algibacter sp. TaxID=1872428 RepID=UPI0026023C7C|nr:T9SS type A sorting domain-containing protein [Algibacter sp.]MDG1728685.1 T9SS type A sorting domain-containing protein [Algibacter sp.]MDG2178482.1 T9SS type A sorting domain-containing protein [Algibacter sp.]